MIHNLRLHAIDVETGSPMDYRQLGTQPRQVRLQFADAAFPSVDRHREELHNDVSYHAQVLHHQYGIMTDDFTSTDHEGRPAFVMTVRQMHP